MRLLTTRATKTAPRMTGIPAVKFRGMQVLATGYGQTLAQAAASYDWTVTQGSIDRAIAMGATAIKFASLTAADPLGPTPSLTYRAAKVCDYARSKGIYVYPWLYDSFSDSPQQTTDRWTGTVSKLVATYEQYPDVVVGYDLVNEGNLNWGWPATITHCQTVRNLIRATGSTMPLSTGISCSSSAALWNSNVQSVSPYLDFYDYHVYYNSGDAVPSDFAAMRTSGFAKKWVVGECGSSRAAGATARVNRYTALKTLAQETDCYGVFAFLEEDPSATSDFGIIDHGGTVYTNVSSVFATWPTA